MQPPALLAALALAFAISHASATQHEFGHFAEVRPAGINATGAPPLGEAVPSGAHTPSYYVVPTTPPSGEAGVGAHDEPAAEGPHHRALLSYMRQHFHSVNRRLSSIREAVAGIESFLNASVEPPANKTLGAIVASELELGD